MRALPAVLLALVLAACEQQQPPVPQASGEAADTAAPQASGEAADTAAPDSAARQPAAGPAAGESGASARLDAILAGKPDEFKERYEFRHPKETLEFFGIEPGMTVVEVLPGGGWYSQVLIPYLGEQGRLIGANYAQDMWPRFGMFDQAFIDSMQTWTTDWPKDARQWQGEDGAAVDAFVLGSMPASLEGQADAVLFIRALHNLARFEDEGGYLTTALEDAYRVLKPGGVLGIVQHEARADTPDDWASGDNGYLKKSFVIERATAAGFELVGESDVNQNPKDRPTTEDFVWRLPPSYMTSRDNPELKAQMDAIGESNRMTLRFRKAP